MLKAKGLCYRLVKSRKATTCALPSEPSPSTSAASSDHRSRCWSMIIKLGRRGLADSAREVTRRVIDGCSSISEATLVADFAVNNGIELDSRCCGALIRKLTEMGQPGLAEAFYNQREIGNGIDPDSSVLDSMVLCLVKLRRFDEARAHLDRVRASGYVPSKKDCSLVVDELCNQDQFLYFEQVKARGSGLWLRCKNLFWQVLLLIYDTNTVTDIFTLIIKKTVSQCTSGGSSMLSPISSITSEVKLSSTTSRRRCTCRVWIKVWKC